jgi:lysophospholipase L1-like esterase
MWVRWMLGALAAVAVVAVYDAVVIARALIAGSQLASESRAFASSAGPGASLPAASQSPSGAKRVLVAGDSTAVGTGAGEPLMSVPGRIARDNPSVLLVNLAEDGARTEALVAQLHSAGPAEYDAVLILVGGNDVLRLTGIDRLRDSIAAALHLATGLSDNVALMTVGDVGSAPAIPWPVSLLLSRRAATLRALFAEEAGKRGVAYVDMHVPAAQTDPFARDPDKYYARDGLHPSAAGYGLWYERLKRKTPLDSWLAGP